MWVINKGSAHEQLAIQLQSQTEDRCLFHRLANHSPGGNDTHLHHTK